MSAGLFVTVCALSSAFGQTQPVPQTPPIVVPLPTVPGAPDVGTPGAGASGSQPEQAKPLTPEDRLKRPLTPEEKLQKEIDKYDPLSRTNPAKPDEPAPAEPVAPAASLATRQGPEVVDSDLSAQASNGPAVLSRSYTLSRPAETKQVQWSWNVNTGQSYTTGLLTGPANKTSTANANSYGNTTGWAISGRHSWKRDSVGLSYSVSFSEYPWASSYSGINQSLSADVSHQFSRRLSLHVTSAGSMTPPSGALDNPLTAPGVSIANLSLAASPSLQPLNSRTRQIQNSANLVWQKSARLSFSLGGGFFAVDRTGLTLSNNIGYQAQADVNYRYNSRTTVGLSYSWTDYIFAGHQSVSDTNTLGIIFSRSFGASTQLRTRIGVAQIESLGYTQVAVDPLFAALVGPSAIVDAYRKSTIPDISAQLVRQFRNRRTASFSYARGVSPGNGIILTAIQQTMTANFSLTVFRRFPLNVTAGRSALASQAQNTGASTSDFFSLGTSRALHSHATSFFAVQYSQFAITNVPGLHNQFSVSTGVSWGPGPGKIW